LASDLREVNPGFFVGSAKTIRNVIARKNIPSSEIAYANMLKNVWNECGASCRKGKLFFTKEYADIHVLKGLGSQCVDEVKLEVKEIEEQKQEKEENQKKQIGKDDQTVDDCDVIDPIDPIDDAEEKQISVVSLSLPPIVDLEPHEMFHDADGNALKIQTRGSRGQESIFFLLQDVMKAFDMGGLDKTIYREKGTFIRGIDYKTFIIDRVGNAHPTMTLSGQNVIMLGATSHDAVKAVRKSTYLTYDGLMRCLFISRNKNARIFQAWAQKILFTSHLGSMPEKQQLAADLLTVSVRAIRDVFHSHAVSFPCVYLLELGTVREVRGALSISSAVADDMVVYKYGMTSNMEKRIGQHNADYGRMTNVSLSLKLFSYIDTRYTTEAEGDIRSFFNGLGMALDVPGRNELVAISGSNYRVIQRQFASISKEYAGATKELQDKIQVLEERYTRDMLAAKNATEHQLLLKDMEVHVERSQKDRYHQELTTNQIIFNLQLKNYELQLKMMN